MDIIEYVKSYRVFSFLMLCLYGGFTSGKP